MIAKWVDEKQLFISTSLWAARFPISQGMIKTQLSAEFKQSLQYITRRDSEVVIIYNNGDIILLWIGEQQDGINMMLVE